MRYKVGDRVLYLVRTGLDEYEKKDGIIIKREPNSFISRMLSPDSIKFYIEDDKGTIIKVDVDHIVRGCLPSPIRKASMPKVEPLRPPKTGSGIK